MAHLYLTHGLVLALPFECPELDPAPPETEAEAWLVEATVPRALADARVREESFDASPTQFLFRGGSRAGRFLVEHGAVIRLERNPGCEEPLLRHLLLHHVLAALLRQRRLLVLHASTAIVAGGAIIVAGESGAGKSSTIAALGKRGWPLQSDDVTALRAAGSGRLEVLPGSSRIHLGEEPAAALALATPDLPRREWHRMKMAVPGSLADRRTPCPVRRLVHLRRGDGTGFAVEPVTGSAKVRLLLSTAYGPLFPEQIAEQLPLLEHVLTGIEMIRITRPADGWTLDRVADAILDGIVADG